jgi:hypothetical protein
MMTSYVCYDIFKWLYGGSVQSQMLVLGLGRERVHALYQQAYRQVHQIIVD